MTSQALHVCKLNYISTTFLVPHAKYPIFDKIFAKEDPWLTREGEIWVSFVRVKFALIFAFINVGPVLYEVWCLNSACHPGGCYWNYFPGNLSCSKNSATPFRIKHTDFKLWVPKFQMSCIDLTSKMGHKADSRFGPSQWETALLCDISHWLGINPESALGHQDYLSLGHLGDMPYWRHHKETQI